MAHMLCPAPGMKLCVSGMQQLVPCWEDGRTHQLTAFLHPGPKRVVGSASHLPQSSLLVSTSASTHSPHFSLPPSHLHSWVMLTWIPSPLLSAQTGPNAITPSQPTDLNSFSCGTTYDHCSHSSNHNTYCYHSFPGQLFCGNQLVLTVIFFYPLFTSATDRSHSSLCINFVPSLSHTCPLLKSPSTHDAPFGYPSDPPPFP
ncbi:hypothetical protein B0H14DRAFT_2701610 [Mycena olivaceomarginata]|nr:hypothetical protein B0H14DRAFT_2701610 [Mycena olivaceomarginata]